MNQVPISNPETPGTTVIQIVQLKRKNHLAFKKQNNEFIMIYKKDFGQGENVDFAN